MNLQNIGGFFVFLPEQFFRSSLTIPSLFPNNFLIVPEQFLKYLSGTVIPLGGTVVPLRGTTVPRSDLQNCYRTTQKLMLNNERIVRHEYKKAW